MSGSYNGVAVPADGKKIGYAAGKYDIPDNPIIPFIEGDGTGRDIWKASLRVFNAAVEKAYKGSGAWRGTKFLQAKKPRLNSTHGCPTTPSTRIREFRVAIKGPADHSRGRRYSLAERRSATDS